MIKKRAPNIKNTPITREKWDKMLKAYRSRPTISYLVDTANVGRRTARRAVMEGWPDLNLPPFIELANIGTSVHKEMAVTRESWEEAAIVQGEAARTAAEEALAARTTMASAVRSLQVADKLSTLLLKRLTDDPEAALPEILTPKDIKTLVDTIKNSAAIVETAMKIERMRAGEPEQILGIQIGMMVERLTDDELDIVVNTGTLPDRLLDQRNQVIDRVTPRPEEDDSISTEDMLSNCVAHSGHPDKLTSQPQIDAEDNAEEAADNGTDPFMDEMKRHLGMA